MRGITCLPLNYLWEHEGVERDLLPGRFPLPGLTIKLVNNMAYHEFHVNLTITTRKMWLNSLGEHGQTYKKNVTKLNLQDKTTKKEYEVINLPFL